MATVDGNGGRAIRAPKVTIESVAALAGVSTATVSRVVNGHPDVSAATRAEVLRYARELGYVNTRASSLDVGKNKVRLIALSVPEMRGDYITEVITGAAEALADRDSRLVICSVDGNRRFEPLPERLLEGTTSGALLLQPSDDTTDLVELHRRSYPFVVVEPMMQIDDSIPAVTISSWAGAKMAAEYLISLGHIHIGIITGPSQLRVSSDRLAGYQAALLSAGLPLTPQLVQEADLTIEGGQEAATRLLSLPHTPSAILALNDSMAVGALRAAKSARLDVPRDVSVMGFGGSEMAAVSMPALTTVQEPLQGLGRVGADMLWKLLQGQQLDASRIELSTTLLIRESTAHPRGTSFLTV